MRYKILIILALLVIQIGLYSLVYFHYHDSPYAEGCPEQKTLLWCDRSN